MAKELPLTESTSAHPAKVQAGVERVREDLAHPDALLDCLVEISRLHGRSVSRAALSAGLPLVTGRLTLALAQRAAMRVGMATKVQRLNLSQLDTAILPTILVLRDNRACVLIRQDTHPPAAESVYTVLFPETGQGSVVLSHKELEERYTGIALFVRPKLTLSANTGHTSEAKSDPATGAQKHWFWDALLRQRLVYRDVLWAAFLINMFALAFPLFAMNVYDRVVPNHAFETLWALAVGVLLVISADLWMRMLRGRFVDEASARIDVDISASLMERVMDMQLANRPTSVGSFAANLRGFEQVRDFIASGTVTALIDLPFALLFVVVMLWICPWMAIPVVLAFILIVLMGSVLQYRLHTLSASTYQACAQRNGMLVESLTGIETIKSQGAQGLIQSRWEQANRYLATLGVQMRSLSMGAQYMTGWIQQFVSMAVIVLGVYLIAQRELTMGGLIAINMLAARVLAPSSQLISLLMQYQGARTAMANLDGLMSQPVERSRGVNYVHRNELHGDIEFKNVRFKYPGRDDMALDGINLKISRGEHVGIIGKVGSGKSTLQKLILGLYPPAEGSVLVDSIDIRQLDPADLRSNMGYVSQDVLLFSGSLRENITFALPYADDSAMVQAAETAGLSEFINRHPRGFDMQVGERGDSLSGGQRQGIGLARAVLHNAPVLLLDEPTSAMDFSTESTVIARLNTFSRDRTMILVTHRASLLQCVDRLVVIDQGKIIADGPKARVLEALQSGRIVKAI